ncbi:universal stress protein [Streptomyces sp. NPDC005931]|uniref:universal stress protein n=1 Tax=Streptomyces sp. NPDC005931 TaxID=3364737 RepID=UPI003673AE86
MTRTVVVGLDGSPASRAAADWAAREAELRQAALRAVHAGVHPSGADTPSSADAAPADPLDELRESLRERHPDLTVVTDRVPERPSAALSAAARDAEILVVGRELGVAAGRLLGSVALDVVARAECPVVLVRADTPDPAGGPDAAHGDVVVALDVRALDDSVLAFAFDAAHRRAAGLRVLHGWRAPARVPVGPAGASGATEEDDAPVRQRLAEALRPWRERYPEVEVAEEAVIGRADTHLTDVSRGASLVVIGHRRAGHRIGAVTRAVLHDAVRPVAVVPHG